MQSKTSFFNMGLFKKNISRTWIGALIYLIILILAMPVTFIISNANSADDYWSEIGYTMEMRLYQHMSLVPTTAFSLVVAIVAVVITFWYLFSKRDTYMMHAFPVNRNSLYFTGLITSLIVSLTPVILTSIIMTIVAIAMGTTSVSCIWYWTFIMVVSTLLFVAIALFSLMITGQLVTGVLFYLIFNFLYIMMEIAFRITASLLMFGMGEALTGINFKVWSPANFIPMHARVSSEIITDDMGNKVESFNHSFDGPGYLLIYAVVAIVIIAISFILYKKKKVETVLDFISVPFMKPIFSVGMSFFISMVAGACVAGMIDVLKPLTYNAKYTVAIISAIIIGIIIYYATQMLIEKTLRVFSIKTLTRSAIYSALALVVLLGMRFDVVKIEDKVPASKDITWAAIDNQYTMVFRNADDIEQVRQLHRNFLDDKKELRDVSSIYPDDRGTSFNIKYQLKNGDVVVRSYSVVDTKAKDVSAQYVAATQPILDFLNEPSRIKEHVIGNTWNTGEITDMTFTTYTYDESMEDFMGNTNYFEELSEKEKKAKYKKVYDALLKDVDEGKVFVQTFDGATYEYVGKRAQYLYNDFYFVIHDDKNEYYSDTQHYWGDDFGYYPMYEQDITVNLSKDCKHTLKALKEEGFYDNEDDILTWEEYNEKMGFDNEAYDDMDDAVIDYASY